MQHRTTRTKNLLEANNRPDVERGGGGVKAQICCHYTGLHLFVKLLNVGTPATIASASVLAKYAASVLAKYAAGGRRGALPPPPSLPFDTRIKARAIAATQQQERCKPAAWLYRMPCLWARHCAVGRNGCCVHDVPCADELGYHLVQMERVLTSAEILARSWS